MGIVLKKKSIPGVLVLFRKKQINHEHGLTHFKNNMSESDQKWHNYFINLLESGTYDFNEEQIAFIKIEKY
jgi:hypothetical protein